MAARVGDERDGSAGRWQAAPCATVLCWPSDSVWRLPLTSNVADSLVASTSFTPSGVVSPTRSVRGLPPSMTTTALPDISPITVMSAAAENAAIRA